MKTKQRKLKITEGDVVLVHEENVKRNRWRLGKIEEVVRGHDGIIRGAVLKTYRDGKTGQIRRPLQKLYPLEITDDQEDTDKDDVAGYGPGDQREDLSEQLHENIVKENSESLGSHGGASGMGIDQTDEDNIEQLLSN